MIASVEQSQTVHIDSEIMSGEPVFIGTRVPLKALVEYLMAGSSLDDFLDGFPSVTREQAQRCVNEAFDALLTRVPTDEAVAR